MLGSLGGDLVWPLLERIVDGDGKGTIAEARAHRLAQRLDGYRARGSRGDPASRRARAGGRGAGGRRARRRARECVGRAPRSGPRAGHVSGGACSGRRDLPLAPDEYAGFTMTLLRMLSFERVAGAQVAQRVEPVAMSRPAPQRSPPRHRSAVAKRRAAQPARTRRTSAPRTGAAAPVDSTATGPASCERLRLTGMAGMVARNAEFVSFENNHLELVVPEIAAHVRGEALRRQAEGRSRAALRREPAPHGAGRARRPATALPRRARARSRRSRRTPPRRSRTIRSCATSCATSAPRSSRLPSGPLDEAAGNQRTRRGEAMIPKGGLGALMKQAQQMQENMRKAQEELAKIEVEGQSGAGLVKVTITCKFQVQQGDDRSEPARRGQGHARGSRDGGDERRGGEGRSGHAGQDGRASRRASTCRRE